MHGDEGAFQKWMRFELDTLHAGLVSQRRTLADLLREAQPSAPARDGTHAFEPAELRRLAQALPTELRYTLRLPIPLYFDSALGDACYVLDRAAAEALAPMRVTQVRPDAQGKVWFSRAVALQAMRDWPTCVQMVYL